MWYLWIITDITWHYSSSSCWNRNRTFLCHKTSQGSKSGTTFAAPPAFRMTLARFATCLALGTEAEETHWQSWSNMSTSSPTNSKAALFIFSRLSLATAIPSSSCKAPEALVRGSYLLMSRWPLIPGLISTLLTWTRCSSPHSLQNVFQICSNKKQLSMLSRPCLETSEPAAPTFWYPHWPTPVLSPWPHGAVGRWPQLLAGSAPAACHRAAATAPPDPSRWPSPPHLQPGSWAQRQLDTLLGFGRTWIGNP